MPASPQSTLAFKSAFAIASFTFSILLLSGNAQSGEYLPGMEWDEPRVVTPGTTHSAPPSDATILFDGTDLSGWQGGENWLVEDGIATCREGNITTKQMFGDCQLHIEWSVPKSVKGKGQGRGNSGVFLMGQYEVQVLDNFNNSTYPEGQAGAIYKQIPPSVNAMRPQGEWNFYDIFWTAPVIDSPIKKESEVIKPATITVVHNGVLVVNHHEVAGATYYNKPPVYENLNDRDSSGNLVGPIMLQDHGNPVQFRNIWVRDLKQPSGTPREPMLREGKVLKKWPTDGTIPE